jgi:putative Holliday junction resolvase
MSVILAIDLGTKRVGFAVSDEDQIVAKILPLFRTKSLQDTVEHTAELVKQHTVSTIIVGNPKEYEDKETPMSKIAEEFTALLQDELPEIEIHMINESMTSVMARQTSKLIRSKKKNIDGEAARIMLQEYLDFIHNQVQ